MFDNKDSKCPAQTAGVPASEDAVKAKAPLWKRIPLLDKVTIVICALIIITGLSLHLVRVVGSSMSPTYENGNLLVTTTHFDAEDISYGSVVVIYAPEDINKHHLIKRVVGLPGDDIRITDGYPYRNGEKVEEEYPPMRDGGVAADTIHLGNDEYFVLGDNRNNSTDSRVFGPVDRSELSNLVKCRFSIIKR